MHTAYAPYKNKFTYYCGDCRFEEGIYTIRTIHTYCHIGINTSYINLHISNMRKS